MKMALKAFIVSFILFNGLIASASEDYVVILSPGDTFQHKIDNPGRELLKCTIIKPDLETVQLYPVKTEDPKDEDVQFLGDPSPDSPCGVQISPIEKQHEQQWTLNAEYEKTEEISHKIEILIREKVDAFPSNSVEVFEKYNLEISFAERIPNVKWCGFKPPAKLKATFPDISITNTDDNCLYTLKGVNRLVEGRWTIQASGDHEFEANVDITIADKPEVDTNVTAVLGAPMSLTLGPESAVYCEATNPSGEIAVRQSGQCKIELERVLESHEGVWEVNVGFAGSLNLHRYDYAVDVVDLGEQTPGALVIQSNIADDESSANIECKLFTESMRSCRIIRGDGRTFILNPGIGMDRYKYFTSSEREFENELHFVHCGIHIDEPTEVDMLPWTCLIVDGEGTERGSFISLRNNSQIDGEQSSEILNSTLTSSGNMSVTIGESFDIKCSYSRPITYCWFKSPNNTIYTVMQSTNETNYGYVGNGWNLGDCGMRVKRSSASDKGIWTCNVGASDTLDERASVSITTYDSLLVAERRDLIWDRGIRIVCSTYDNSPLDYCHFIRPDGRGINPIGTDSDIYSGNGTNLAQGRCQLDLYKYYINDVGRWLCIGKSRFHDIDHVDRVHVYNHYWIYYNPSSHALIWFLWVLTMLTLVTILSLMVFRYHSNNARGRRSRIRSSIRRSFERMSSRFSRRSNPPPYTPPIAVINENNQKITEA